MIYFNSEKKSPLLAFIKSESTFLTGSLAVCLSAPVQGEAGGILSNQMIETKKKKTKIFNLNSVFS